MPKANVCGRRKGPFLRRPLKNLSSWWSSTRKKLRWSFFSEAGRSPRGKSARKRPRCGLFSEAGRSLRASSLPLPSPWGEGGPYMVDEGLCRGECVAAQPSRPTSRRGRSRTARRRDIHFPLLRLAFSLSIRYNIFYEIIDAQTVPGHAQTDRQTE